MNPTFDDLRRSLHGVTRDKGDRFDACCPAHDDKNPSLSVKHDGDKVLLHCHRGCDHRDICAVLNIDHRTLSGPPIDILGNRNKESDVVYRYKTELDELAYEVVRFPEKNFRPRRPVEGGKWEYGLKGVERILYRLPELKTARKRTVELGEVQTIYICEGEKDVETLLEQGLTATCNPFGAGKWRDEFNRTVANLDCVILPDNDEPGEKHAAHVAASIMPFAARVRVLRLPGLPEKGDVSDWFAAGHTIGEFTQLSDEAAEWKSPSNGLPSAGGLQFIRLVDLLAKPVQEVAYVWDGLLPVRGVSVFTGKPKLGKSTIMRNLAIAIATGESFIGRATTKGRVLYFCLEEIESQVQQHFARMGASNEEILICTYVNGITFPDDLRKAIALYDPIAVLVDPMSRVVRERDFNDYAKMAQALEPIIDIARVFPVHIMMAHHDGKISRSGSDGVLGSTAIFGGADTHIQISFRGLGERTLKSTNRYGTDLEETVVTLDRDTGLISAAQTWGEMLKATWEEKVFDCMTEGEELTETQIKDRVGTTGAVSKAIRALVKQELFERSGPGTRGKPSRYRKIVSNYPGAEF